jgi:hypothetical protein
MEYGAASSLTEAGPWRNRSKIERRVESDSATKVLASEAPVVIQPLGLILPEFAADCQR